MAILILVLPAGLSACMVCLPFPGKTMADSLIESESVVFAREDPERPFAFRVTAVVKGKGAERIDHFVDSVTRRRLAINKQSVVILVRGADSDRWRSLGVANRELQQIARRVLTFAPAWSGSEGGRRRAEYFLTLFGHPERAIFDLAWLELSRAPYGVIQRLGGAVPADVLDSMLTRREYLEWRGLAILLLAQRGTDGRARIESSFDACSRFSSTRNLGHWAAAWIEVGRGRAVDEIRDKYLSNPRRTDEEVRAVVTALSMHAREGRVELRDQIVNAYAVAIERHPGVAGLIAKDLADWQRDEYQGSLARVLANHRSRLSDVQIRQIRRYLRAARTDQTITDRTGVVKGSGSNGQ